MKKILISSGSVVMLGLPAFALAAEINTDYVSSFFTKGSALLSNIVIFLMGLAVVWFIWNVVRYAMSDDESGKEKAKSQMVHGIIAIAVTVSIWGLVGLLRTAFGVNGNSTAPTNLDNMIPGGSSGSGSNQNSNPNSWLNSDRV